MKKCTKCGEQKPLSEFYTRKTAKDGRRNDCKSCNVISVRDRRLKRVYGLSIAIHEKMIKSQNGNCEICKTKLFANKNTHVDHCHKTGSVRGILCQNCNTALGSFRDSIEILKSAQKYLQKYSKKNYKKP